MNRYLEKIEPIVKGLIELTKEKKMEWEKVGMEAFRCVDSVNNMSVEISKYTDIVGEVVSLKLYTQNKLCFEYSPSYNNSDFSFDKLLDNLYSLAEEQDVNSVVSKFKSILKQFEKE